MCWRFLILVQYKRSDLSSRGFNARLVWMLPLLQSSSQSNSQRKTWRLSKQWINGWNNCVGTQGACSESEPTSVVLHVSQKGTSVTTKDKIVKKLLGFFFLLSATFYTSCYVLLKSLVRDFNSVKWSAGLSEQEWEKRELKLAGNLSKGFRGLGHSGTDAPFFQSAAVTAATRPDQATTDGVRNLKSTPSVQLLSKIIIQKCLTVGTSSRPDTKHALSHWHMENISVFHITTFVT